MESQQFDEAAYNRSLGLDDTPQVDVPEISLDDDGKAALREIDAQYQGNTRLPTETAPDDPEYLKDRAVPKPPSESIDWMARYAEKFGMPPQEGQPVTAETYHIESARRIGESEYLAQFNGFDQHLQAVIDRQVDPIELLQQTVRQQLADNGLTSEASYTDRIDTLVQDGQLTDAGRLEYQSIVKGAKQQLDDIRRLAAEHGQIFADFRTTFHTVLPRQIESILNEWGIELDSADMNRIQNRVKSGAGQEWLGEYRSVEEAARKDALISIFSDPYLLEQRDRRIFELGMKHGQAVKIGKFLK
jgi:hypothetical protein